MDAFKITIVFNEFGLKNPTKEEFIAGLLLDLLSFEAGTLSYFAQDGIDIEIEKIPDLLEPGEPDGRD